jgi:type II secretory pathway pseudopilin PulG
VAIIGILAAIAIPNLLTAMQRSRQKRSMADMRTIATAWESRATETNKYNAAGAQQYPTGNVQLSDLETYLCPTYIRKFPHNDGWSNSFIPGLSRQWGSTTVNANDYSIVCTGKDGVLDSNPPLGPVTNFDCDLIFSNGMFLQYPEGVQQQ